MGLEQMKGQRDGHGQDPEVLGTGSCELFVPLTLVLLLHRMGNHGWAHVI